MTDRQELATAEHDQETLARTLDDKPEARTAFLNMSNELLGYKTGRIRCKFKKLMLEDGEPAPAPAA